MYRPERARSTVTALLILEGAARLSSIIWGDRGGQHLLVVLSVYSSRARKNRELVVLVVSLFKKVVQQTQTPAPPVDGSKSSIGSSSIFFQAAESGNLCFLVISSSST